MIRDSFSQFLVIFGLNHFKTLWLNVDWVNVDLGLK
jgi:hypothetical protein